MGQRNFRLRLSSRYGEKDNAIESLQVAHFHDGEWAPFELGVTTPGFLIFVYAIFTCQHLYLRANAAENGLALDSASGAIEVTTSEAWQVEEIRVDFDCRLRNGEASDETIDYIISRMEACPVSLNLRQDLTFKTSVTMS